MKKLFLHLGLLAVGVVSAETLVDFARSGVVYRMVSAAYAGEAAREQMSIGNDGLVARFDAAKETTPAPWATIAVPPDAAPGVVWDDRTFDLVLRRKPTGRARSDIAINFTDRDGETFQFMPRERETDVSGALRLRYRVDLSNPPASHWGGSVRNGRLDPPIRLSALNVHFDGVEGYGEATFVRIEPPPAEAKVERSVVSREPICTDTTYPGAAPFPGAEALEFRVEPACTGRVTLVLSTESTGSAAQGRMLRFPVTAAPDGRLRCDCRLPFNRRYQFMRLAYDSPVAGGHTLVSATGTFRQTAAEAMRFTVDVPNELGLVRDASERPSVFIANPTETPCAWRADIRLRDIFGRVLAVPFEGTVAAGGTTRVALPWPLPAKGLWRVTAAVTAADGSTAVKEGRFAYIDRHTVTPVLAKPKFRMGIHYHGTHYLPGLVDRTIDALVASGAKFTRTDYSFMFADIEPAPGARNWAKADLLLKKMRAAGLALEIIVGGTPEWAVDPDASCARTNIPWRVGCRPAKPGLFRAFCERFARRYAGEIDYYEVGNEWDLVPAAQLTHEEALRMQREAYEGLHAGDPGACVTPNGWAGATSARLPGPERDNPGLIEAFAAHPELYDAWSLHLHGTAAGYISRLQKEFFPLRARSGLATRPWISGETALSSGYGEEDSVARAVWQKILYAWSWGARDYIWYNLRATGWFDGNEPGYGLITADFRPRAGYAAFSALTTIFEGLDADGRLVSAGGRHLFRFKGEKPDFRGMVVAGWDSVRREVERVRIRTDAKTALLADLMNNRTPVPVVDGAAVLPLDADPQALLLPDATRAEYAPETR